MIFDVIIIGSGPVGLAAAIECKRQGLSFLVLEKGVLCNSLYNFPTFMRFFTTADLLEIGNHPFPSTHEKPTRQITLDYYRRVTQVEELPVLQHHQVEEIDKIDNKYHVRGKNNNHDFEFYTKFVVIATGYFDNPVGLGVPGEDKSICSYRYREPHGYYDHDIAIIGAGNSGAEAALELYRHGARVTLFHRHEQPRDTLKYWIKTDLINRLKEGAIKGIMPSRIIEITDNGLRYEYNGEINYMDFDHIFILTGYTPDIKHLRKWGLEMDDDSFAVKINDKFETNLRNVYIIGSAGFGRNTNSVFIENGREHAVIAIKDIVNKLFDN